MGTIVKRCILLLLAIGLYSCNLQDEDSDAPNNSLSPIQLYALTPDGGFQSVSITDFLQNNQIGVFSYSGDALSYSQLAFNKQHRLDKQSCINPCGNDEDCRIDITSTTHFMAYSPFVELSDVYYPIDLRKMPDDNHRFLYARNAVAHSGDNQQVSLTFQCQLSHLKLVLLDSSGVGIGTNTAEITICRPVCASFDLSNGVLLVDETSIDELSLPLIRSRIATTVLPGKGGEIRVSYQGDI